MNDKLSNNLKSIKSTSITKVAYDLARNEVNRRKAEGLSASVTAVISEAVVSKLGIEVK